MYMSLMPVQGSSQWKTESNRDEMKMRDEGGRTKDKEDTKIKIELLSVKKESKQRTSCTLTLCPKEGIQRGTPLAG
jgi:hypothetical protein